jgi:hypothetical protein
MLFRKEKDSVSKAATMSKIAPAKTEKAGRRAKITLSVGAAGLLIATFGIVHRWEHPRFESLAKGGGPEMSHLDAARPQQEAPLRDASRPLPIDVPVADLGEASSTGFNTDSPVAAEIAIPDSPLPRVSLPTKSEENQSDAEMIDLPPELPHAVAPVPMQNQSIAALHAAVASINHAEMVARIVPTANLANQASATAARRVVVVDVAPLAIAGTPNRATAGRWRLIDETPVADPSALVDSLPIRDSLRPFAVHWLPASEPHADASSAVTLLALDQAIANSAASWQVLYEMGRVSGILDDQRYLEQFWRAAVARGSLAAGHQNSVTQRDARLMQVLAGTFIWTWRNDEVAAQALNNAMRWHEPDWPG